MQIFVSSLDHCTVFNEARRGLVSCQLLHKAERLVVLLILARFVRAMPFTPHRSVNFQRGALQNLLHHMVVLLLDQVVLIDNAHDVLFVGLLIFKRLADCVNIEVLGGFRNTGVEAAKLGHLLRRRQSIRNVILSLL